MEVIIVTEAVVSFYILSSYQTNKNYLIKIVD